MQEGTGNLTDKLQKILLAGLFLAAIYFTAGLVNELTCFVSVGYLFMSALAPAVFFWGLLLVVYLYQQGSISFDLRFGREEFFSKVLFWILSIALLASWVILKFGRLGAPYILLGAVCVIGILAAFMFIIRRENSKGLIIVLLIYPFIIFIEHWFRWNLSGDPYEVRSINIFMPYEIIWLAIFFVMLTCKIVMENNFVFRVNAIQKLFLLFGLFVFVSALVSPIPLTGIKYVYRDCALPLIFLFIFIESIKTIDDFIRLFKGVIFSGMSLLLMGIYFFWRNGGFYSDTAELFRGVLATTVTGYLNLISILSLLIMPTAISLYLVEKNMLGKVAQLCFALICLVVIVLSRNRSVQLACIITLPFLFVYARARMRYAFFSILFIILIVGLLKVSFVQDMAFERYKDWFGSGNFVSNILTSDSISFDLWYCAIRIFRDHFWVGIGPGMWEQVYPSYTSMPGDVIWASGNKPHSLFLQYFTFSGIGAGLCLVFIYAYTIIKSIRRTVSVKNKETYIMAVGLSWSICLLFLHELIRGYQVFNYYGFTVMAMCLFFGLDNILTQNLGLKGQDI